MTAPVRKPVSGAATEPSAALAQLELRHAWLRLAGAMTELEWADAMLRNGTVTPRGALAVLDDAMGELTDGDGT